MNGKRLISALLCLLCLSGCAQPSISPTLFCRVVLEEGDDFTCDDYTRTMRPGDSVDFYIRCDDGYEIMGADCENASLTSKRGGMTILSSSGAGPPLDSAPPLPLGGAAGGKLAVLLLVGAGGGAAVGRCDPDYLAVRAGDRQGEIPSA